MAVPRSSKTKEEVVRDFRTSAILEAARRVIGEIGYEGASMERIAQEAGIAKGTTYLYFKNKEALLVATFERGFEQFMARTRAATEAAPTHAGKVRGLVRAFFEHTEENQAFYQALYGRPDVGPDGESAASEEIRKEIEAYEQFVAGLLDRAIRDGEFRAVDPTRCGRFLTELLRGVVATQLRGRGTIEVGAEIEAVLDFFFYGVAKGVAQ